MTIIEADQSKIAIKHPGDTWLTQTTIQLIDPNIKTDSDWSICWQTGVEWSWYDVISDQYQWLSRTNPLMKILAGCWTKGRYKRVPVHTLFIIFIMTMKIIRIYRVNVDLPMMFIVPVWLWLLCLCLCLCLCDYEYDRCLPAHDIDSVSLAVASRVARQPSLVDVHLPNIF